MEKQKSRMCAEPTFISDEPMKTELLFWSWYARCYDGLLSTIPYRRLLDQTINCLPVGVATLLDAGCGTGNLLAAIRRRRPKLALHGIDFSEAMLRRARRKVSAAQFLPGDLNAELPYADESFEVVTCINVLYALAAPAKTLAELRRVLRPGGTLIVSSPLAQPKIAAFIRGHAAESGWIRTAPLLVRLTVLIMFNVLILHRGHAGQYHFLDEEEVRKLLGRTPITSITHAYAGQNWFACAKKD